MWLDFGKPFTGYNLGDFEAAVWGEFPDQGEIHTFFSAYIYGNQDLFPILNSLLSDIGIRLDFTFGEDWLLHQLGIRTNHEGWINQIHPDSKAHSVLTKNDRFVNWPVEKNSETNLLELQIDRNGRFLEVSLEKENGEYFPVYRLHPKEINLLTEKWKA